MPSAPPTPLRVFLADDSHIMRDAIRKLLDEEPSIHIVGEAESFAETIQLLPECEADVLILDLHMPQKHELQAQTIKSELSSVPHTVAISFANDEEARKLAASYGASALLDKMSLYADLTPAILRLTSASSATGVDLSATFPSKVAPGPDGNSSQISD